MFSKLWTANRGETAGEGEAVMAKQLANIKFAVDGEQIKRVAASGRLEEFIARATELFGRDLRAQLEAGTVSSLSTALFMIDNEFVSGPRPPVLRHLARKDAPVNQFEDAAFQTLFE